MHIAHTADRRWVGIVNKSDGTKDAASRATCNGVTNMKHKAEKYKMDLKELISNNTEEILIKGRYLDAHLAMCLFDEEKRYTFVGEVEPCKFLYRRINIDDKRHDTREKDDVVEVKHGCWTEPFPHLQSVKCSVCSKTSLIKSKYCPNCGAKMDVKTPDEEG